MAEDGTTETNRVGQSIEQVEPALSLVFEANAPLAPSLRVRLGSAISVQIGRGRERTCEAERSRRGSHFAITVPDRHMSSDHARLRADRGRWTLEDAGSKNGSLINGAKVRSKVLDDGDVIELGRSFFVYRDRCAFQPNDPEILRLDDAHAMILPTIIPDVQRGVVDVVTRVAPSAVPVVLGGETGTGKEVVARALHELSTRRGPFIAVNCGSIADELVEGELFGYRAGAFSGARKDHPGYIRAADRGTLFLDEIGDLPLDLQSAFLRVLQDKNVTPLGETRAVPVDFRLICATNRDIGALVSQGRFRADLDMRLGKMRIALPALRDRKEDLGILIASVLRTINPSNLGAITFDLLAARALVFHAWPGNIRELYKCLEAAIVLAPGDVIRVEDLAPELKSAGTVTGDVEESALRRHLRDHGGKVKAVARAMRKDPTQIRRLLKRYGIDPEEYRD